MGTPPARRGYAAEDSRLFSALNNVALAASAGLEPEELARTAIDHACSLIGADVAMLYWHDRREDALSLLATNIEIDDVAILKVRPSQGAVGATFSSGEPVLIDDYAAWSGAIPALIRRGISSAMAVPLRIRDKPVGALVAGSFKSHHWEQEDLGLLRMFAAQAAPAIEASMVGRERDLHAKRFKVLHELAVAAGGVLDPQQLADLTVDRTRDLLGAWSATLIWYEAGNRLRVVSDNHPVEVPLPNLEAAEGITRQIAATGDMIVVNNYPAWEHSFKWAVDAGVKSMIGVPLKVLDRTVGCLLVRAAELGHFTHEHQELLSLLAAQIAPTLHAAWLSADHEAHARRFRALHELAVEASGILEPAELARIASDRCRDLLNVDGTVILVHDADANVLRPLNQADRQMVDPWTSVTDGAIGTAFHESRLVAVDDYRGWDRRISGPAERGLSSALCTPLMAGESAIGVLAVWTTMPRHWTEQEKEIVSLVAAQVSPALQQAGIAKEREEQAETLRSLHELAIAANGVLEAEVLAAIAGDKACELVGGTSCVIQWWDEQAKALRKLSDSEPGMNVGDLQPPDSGALGRAFTGRQPVVVSDYQTWEHARANAIGAGVKSMIAVPLLVQDRTVGAIAVRSRKKRSFDHRHVRLLALLAATLAPSLEAARLHGHLVASERNVRAIFETAPVGIARLDARLRILEVNRRAEELSGRRTDELVGRSALHFLVTPGEFAAEMKELLDGSRAQLRFERPIKRHGGQPFIADLTLSAVPGPTKEPDFFYVIFDDITERRRAEDALRESEGRKSAIVQSALDCIVAADDLGKIIEFNPAAEKTFGHHRSEVIGKVLWDVIIPPALREKHDQEVATLGSVPGRPIRRRLETIGVKADGSQFPIELSLAFFQQEGRKTMSASIRDLSERFHAETMRQESEAKSRFVAAMSHELRTPLNSILGFSQLLTGPGTGELNERQQRYVGHIESSGRHLLALINDVLDLSKVAAGQMEVELEPIEVGPMIDEALNQLRPMADAKPLQLIHEPGPAIWVRADRRRFLQVLLNLLSNAVKFTPGGGTVRVRSARAARRAEISVIDTGPGIPEHELKRIFEEFTQVERAGAAGAEGTGLGLALSRRLIELMRGEISVKSELGTGSQFTIRLHRVRPAEVADARPLLLVVQGADPDPELLTKLEKGAYRVIATGTPREAAQIARRRRLSGVIIGSSVSESDQSWLREALKDHPRTGTVPIISAAVALHPGVLISA
ncbi:MAG: GAF domain-containing protein [Candidatus Dormibacteraeota bacterium]|nr:GAF domain-containing protein [Candidatus Dormibacteraeota bacterium]